MSMNYFNIVSLGWNKDLEREEIQIHCGDNGNLFLIKTDDGFKLQVFGQYNIIQEFFFNENELAETVDEEYLEPYEPTFMEVRKLISDWGLSDEQTRANLYYLKGDKLDEYISMNYFWIEEEKVWIPREIDEEDDRRIADYLLLNYGTPINDTTPRD